MADNKLEQMLEKLVNNDRAGADELFHEFVIEKSRGIYEKMLENDLEDLEVDEAKDEEVDEATDEEETNEATDEEVEAWRLGHRYHWPAPDGRSFAIDSHPIAATGSIGWIEAWEIARPWFVDPDAKPFMMNAVHPEHWFQGEYDLVYRWGEDKSKL